MDFGRVANMSTSADVDLFQGALRGIRHEAYRRLFALLAVENDPRRREAILAALWRVVAQATRKKR
jgi:hypothetical protein